MPRPRIATVLLLGMLGSTLGCADLMVQRAGDALRRQQVGSQPHATGVDSRKGAPGPTRAIIHGATYDAADGLVDGLVDSLEDPDRQDKLDALADKLEERVESISEGAGEAAIVGVNAKLPEMQGTITRMVRNLRRDLDLDPEKTVQKVFRQVGKSLESEVRPQVKLMIKEVLDEAMGPGLQERMDNNVTPAVRELTKDLPTLVGDIAEQAVTRSLKAANEGIAPVQSKFQETTEEINRGLLRLLIVLLVVLAIVATVVGFLWWRARGQRESRDRMLRMVASAIKQVGEEGTVGMYRQKIKEIAQLNRNERATLASLRSFLTREELKL
ncbi:MAG: hypothetical protein H6712_09415 [Myxococcales bacterium]|nr:hypothetical protein [Myxococcales bacterium]MCB9714061.1 hypothetical protein [Myxococcales bacterium]